MKKSKVIVMRMPVTKGPYQDNGASPWYSMVKVGTDSKLPNMKLNFDTGARFIWVTSTECNTVACNWPTRIKFNPNTSQSFDWIDQNITEINFGPWGTMKAKVGSDEFCIDPAQPGFSTIREKFYVTTEYDGQQFNELNWDGGIGIPSGSLPDPKFSNLILEFLNSGRITPDQAVIAFHMNPDTRMGVIEIGDFDRSAIIPESRVNVDFSSYKGLKYIWTTPLGSWRVGNVEVATNKMFCHDTGSSQFKGDSGIMIKASNEVYTQYAQLGHYPDLELTLGKKHGSETPAKFVLTEDQYVTLIEAGAGHGEHTININPLAGLDNLVLVGSILMDNIYTVYRFIVTGAFPNYSLAPGQVEMYNKVGGPTVIQP